MQVATIVATYNRGTEPTICFDRSNNKGCFGNERKIPKYTKFLVIFVQLLSKHIFGSVPLLQVATIVATCNRGPFIYEPMFGSQMNQSVCALAPTPPCGITSVVWRGAVERLQGLAVGVMNEEEILGGEIQMERSCSGGPFIYEPMFGSQMNQSVCALAPCGITTATLRAVISVVWRCARWREVQGGERWYDSFPFVPFRPCPSAAF